MIDSYPDNPIERSRWIRRHRSPRQAVDITRVQSWFIEEEIGPGKDWIRSLTLLLTSRECPWHCLMCDLWKSTIPGNVPAGAIPGQIRAVLAEVAQRSAQPALPPTDPLFQIKLYNSGSFFDLGAVPRSDYEPIAGLITGFQNVVVESHPSLIHHDCVRFRDQLRQGCTLPGDPHSTTRMEVAMGLETVHPEALQKLNKRVTLERFRSAAEFLRDHEIALRVFVLVEPPFVAPAESVEWTTRSTEFAFDCGARLVALIPTRPGNGALDQLIKQGRFRVPSLATLDLCLSACLRLGKGTVVADLWDLEQFSTCHHCLDERVGRLQAMNRGQVVLPLFRCPHCGE